MNPWQPPGLWEQLTTRPKFRQVYEPSHGADLRRRSLYTYWKRASHHPTMASFDAPNREVCTVQREATTTPQQALTLLHDPQFVEAARGLAQRMLQDPAFGNTLRKRISRAFLHATGRRPGDREVALLERLHETEQARLEDHPEEAAALLRVGESTVPDGLNPVRLAAATMTARAILNLSETVTLD